MVSQPERSTSITASTSSGSSRRSKSGTSGNVPVAGIERVGEPAGFQCADDLPDPLRHGHGHLIAQPPADLLEGHLVVARVLVAMNVGDLASVGDFPDLLDEVQL